MGGIEDEYAAIGDICRNKYRRARFEDRDFDTRKYVWVLGKDVVNLLAYYNTYYVVNRDNIGTPKVLMGISIQIDYDLPNRISLFKEVRDD